MCVTLDSAYSGDTLFQIARDIWGLNMVGTCQVNRSGAFPHAVKDKSSLKVINIVHSICVMPCVMPCGQTTTLLNLFQTFTLQRSWKQVLESTFHLEVPCPSQQKHYSSTFHLIDKGNRKESKYDMGGQTKGHYWAPKLSMRFWNFGLP
eukprot:scaffold63911_cov67-Cyclotella_meneghiniana.AAC.6